MRRLLAALAVLGLSGCGSTLPPLPGGAPTGPGFDVIIEFTDVLDLVPQAAVKVNDVTVGSVREVWLAGWTARVRVRVGRDVRLPDNTTAAVRQTSLLGEKFVDLAPPGDAPQGQLGDGDVIPLARTRRSVEVEEVLGALGLVLNGGGLDQLRTINAELGSALAGRESDARDALRQLDTFIGGLDEQKAEIGRAIDALDRLSARLSAQRATIGAAVDALAPGLRVLADQRAALTRTLVALGDLGVVGSRVVNGTREDTLAIVRDLRPVLDQLVRAGDALPKALDFMVTFPFPPNAGGAIAGNQVNLHLTLDLDAAEILANLLAAAPPAAQPGTPVIPNLPVPAVPTLPSLPLPLPSISLTPIPLPSLPIPLPSLPGLPGLPVARGAAPAGAADGNQGGYGSIVAGGLSA